MKYVVEVCYANSNEWSNEMEHYFEALQYALEMSKLAGVCETRVYLDKEIVDVCVDGDYVEEPTDEWAEYDEPHYPFDECGYGPYTGGFDPDL